MKIFRTFITVILAFTLFITIYLSLQWGLIYQTLYSKDFVYEIMDDSNIVGHVITSITSLTKETVEDRMLESNVPIDMDTLIIELTTALESGDVEDSINDMITGLHGYYFGDEKRLPVIKTAYLDDIYNNMMIHLTQQVVIDNGLADLSKVSNALDAGYRSGIIDVNSVDSAIDYLRNSHIEMENSDLMIAFIEAYNESKKDNNAAPTSLEDTLNQVVLSEYIGIETLPTKVDLHKLVTTLYEDEVNPITRLKAITYEIPKNLFWILLICLIGLPLIYLVAHQLNILSTIQFVSITGLMAALFSLLGSVILYWFAPSKGVRAFIDIKEVPLLEDFLNFIDLLLNRSMAEAIKINLITLIVFVILLVIIEVIKRSVKKDHPVNETTSELLLQIGSTIVLIALVVLLVRYENHLIANHIRTFTSTLKAYKDFTIDQSLLTDMNRLFSSF